MPLHLHQPRLADASSPITSMAACWDSPDSSCVTASSSRTRPAKPTAPSISQAHQAKERAVKRRSTKDRSAARQPGVGHQ